MLTESFIKEVYAIEAGQIQKDVPMSEYTSFKIGGPADLLIKPKDAEALGKLIALCKRENVPFLMIGAGSNLLVSDQGIDGVVCRLATGFDSIEIQGDTITAGAAVSLAALAKAAQRAGLSGLEFASGIPGSLGGAIFMNAGAYGGEMKDVILETEYLDESGVRKTIVGDSHEFSYRHSVFCENKGYILSAKMRLVPKDPGEILETMRDLNARRKEKQPLDKPSAGSTFKRPEGFFAAKLIEDAGLKGTCVGSACVSEKHAGFVVNNGGATCADVVTLMQKVQKTVSEKFGVSLEPEVKIIGR